MDLLEDLGFALDLEECDISEEGVAADPESTDVLAAARRFQSGRSAAQQAYGDGKWRVGAGPMRLDWRCCVERMLSTTSLAEREECVRALGILAQVALHGDAMREAGVVGGVTSLLSDPHEPVAIAAAEANPNPNRNPNPNPTPNPNPNPNLTLTLTLTRPCAISRAPTSRTAR